MSAMARFIVEEAEKLTCRVYFGRSREEGR